MVLIQLIGRQLKGTLADIAMEKVRKMCKKIVEFPNKKLIEEEACQWVVRFEGNAPLAEDEIDAFKAWLARSPVHRKILTRYASLWENMEVLSELNVPLGKIKAPENSATSKLVRWLMGPLLLLKSMPAILKKPKFTSATSWAIVSMFIVTLAAILVISDAGNQSGARIVYSTSTGERDYAVLPDGSKIWLNTESELVVDYSEKLRRIVLYSGEAYFEVAKDQTRPFEVYAGSKLFRAIGTAFSVYKEHSGVRVTVTEGKVELAVVRKSRPPPTKDGLSPLADASVGKGKHAQRKNSVDIDLEFEELIGSLSAGQSVMLPKQDAGSVDKVVSFDQQELTRQVSWRDGLLVFAGEPLSVVVEEVSRYTPIKITVADDEIKTMRVGGQFQTGEVEALFDVLEAGFGLQVSHLDKNHVEIRSGTR